MSGPAGDRLIRVDMTNQSVSIDPFPDPWKLLGGRALSAKILLDEALQLLVQVALAVIGRQQNVDLVFHGTELARHCASSATRTR